MNVIIDTERCMGNGLCIGVAPAFFRLTDDGVGELIGEPGENHRALMLEAVRLCPTNAISIRD